MEVWINKSRVSLSPSQSIGQGGEAEIFDLGNGLVAKIFKQPKHPDFLNDPIAQKGAKERLAIHQRKLPAFPKNLPAQVITPQELIRDKKGEILGYTMPYLAKGEVLLKYSEKGFRESGGVDGNKVVALFKELHAIVKGIHHAQVVIGDFNDLNVLVSGLKPFMIDADSMQFQANREMFYCTVFTEAFADPILCDGTKSFPMLVKPFNEDSDWYAFCVLLMKSLLYVGPYGGVYKPKDLSKKVPQAQRPLKRITVFDPEVKYPGPAIHYQVLPDDLLHQFHQVFEKDHRGEFPIKILENTLWMKCPRCGALHARTICPDCSTASPSAVKETLIIRGNITARTLFKTGGTIVQVMVEDGVLRWIYHENGEFKREDGFRIVSGELDPQIHFRIRGKSTLLAKGSKMIKIVPGSPPVQTQIEAYQGGTQPVFDTHKKGVYYIYNGTLMREGEWRPLIIGQALSNQTLFWVGDLFGFGFYRAANLCVYFVFDTEHPGINDTIKLPPIHGQLLDATCEFSNDWAWFFTVTQEQQKTVHTCTVLNKKGELLAREARDANDGSWLGSRIRGHLAVGKRLFAATDEGLVRLELTESGAIHETKRFPDTEPFLDSGKTLLAGKDGIFVAGQKEISLIKIN
jgi:H/ACA ribonucleoprotein complex subunit 3